MDLSVIIVEYKDIGLLEKAVLSVLDKTRLLDREVIIVSNSSYSQHQQEEIQAKFKGVSFIFNRNNLGFAKAVNQGIRRSTGEFLLLLNPDAGLLDENLPVLMEFMRKNKQVAVVGPMIIDREGNIQDSCRRFISLRKAFMRVYTRVRKSHQGGVLDENIDYTKPQKVDWISGACIIVKWQAVEVVGVMDERYFMYMEDMDWCRRFWQHGWEVWYQPGLKVEHNAGRGSTSHFSFKNKLMWIHIASFCKYYVKWHLNLTKKPLQIGR